MKNFIPINRKFFNNFLWKERRKFNRAEAWLDLLQIVSYDMFIKTKIINNKVIEYGYAQYPISISFLEKRWLWSKGKVRVFLTALVTAQMATLSTTQGTTLITICNYADYNGQLQSESTVTDPPKAQGLDTSKEIKKRKNKEFIPPTPKEIQNYGIEKGYKIDGEFIFNYYNENDWYDSRNKKVLNWKQKIRGVWFKEENKIKENINLKNRSWKVGFSVFHGNDTDLQNAKKEFGDKLIILK